MAQWLSGFIGLLSAGMATWQTCLCWGMHDCQMPAEELAEEEVTLPKLPTPSVLLIRYCDIRSSAEEEVMMLTCIAVKGCMRKLANTTDGEV